MKNDETNISQTAEMTSILPHLSTQLLTPLDTMQALARLLSENRDGNLTPQQIEWAQVIHTSGEDLRKLLEELLTLAKANQKQTGGA